MQSVLLWDGSAIQSTRVLSNRLKLTLLPRRVPVDDRRATLLFCLSECRLSKADAQGP